MYRIGTMVQCDGEVDVTQGDEILDSSSSVVSFMGSVSRRFICIPMEVGKGD